MTIMKGDAAQRQEWTKRTGAADWCGATVEQPHDECDERQEMAALGVSDLDTNSRQRRQKPSQHIAANHP